MCAMTGKAICKDNLTLPGGLRIQTPVDVFSEYKGTCPDFLYQHCHDLDVSLRQKTRNREWQCWYGKSGNKEAICEEIYMNGVVSTTQATGNLFKSDQCFHPEGGDGRIVSYVFS